MMRSINPAGGNSGVKDEIKKKGFFMLAST